MARSRRARADVIHPHMEMVTVTHTGACPNGHQNSATLTLSVPAGRSGTATCDGSCARCRAPVHMTGSF